MNNIEIMGQIAFVVVLFVVGTLMILYVYYWRKFKKAYEQEMQKPLGPSQEALNKTAKRDVVEAYKMIGGGMFKTSWVLFKMKTNNPALLKPLRGIRRTLLAFILFPFVMAAILVTLTIMMTS